MKSKSPIYDRFAPRYECVIGPLEHLYLSKLRKETLSLLESSSRVLEIGAGTGLNFPHYPSSACGVASELSYKMIEIAKAKEKPENVQLVQASAEQIPFRDNSFDAAFATLVFCSLQSPQDAFAELKRVVRPNGKIVLLEHVRPKGLLGPVFDVLNIFTTRLFEDHFNRRTVEEAENVGLQVLRVKQKAASLINIIELSNQG